MGCCKKSFAQRGLFWGVLFAILFVLCFLWYFAIKAPVLQELYLNLHRMSFLWFSGMNFASFVSGLVQSFIFGWIVAAAITCSYYICGCDKGEEKK